MDHPVIISWTLAGACKQEHLTRALQSAAPVVDAHLLVWTGGWAESSRLAASVRAQSDTAPLHERQWPWTGHFADARNAALDASAKVEGATWGVMLDSDESIVCPDPAALRAYLDAQPESVHVVLVHHEDRSHTRERIFRLPTAHKFAGRTHEMFMAPRDFQVVAPPELIRWREEPKTRDDLRTKMRRDAELLRADLAEGAPASMSLYYLGYTLQILALYEREDGNETAAVRLYNEAIDCYRKHRQLDIDPSRPPAWHEGTALSCYRAAECYLALTQPERALECATAGLLLDSRVGELYHIAAVSSLQMAGDDPGRYAQAGAWALSGALHGLGSWAERQRIGFRIVQGLTQGCAQVLEEVARHELAIAPRHRFEGSTDGVHITVVSPARNAAEWAARCTASVARQSFKNCHIYIDDASDDGTGIAAIEGGNERTKVQVNRTGRRGVLANLLAACRELPPDEVVVWLDGDDWLVNDDALQIVAEAHASGALVTYGQFKWHSTRRIGFAAPTGPDPRSEPWRATILRTFRAGLVTRIKDEDLRWPDGSHLDLACDQAVMLPVLEMAGQDRARFIPQILAEYNDAGFLKMTDTERAREAEAVQIIRSRPRYERVEWTHG
jgi:tetratricopeptide (TPR) repeat protein